MKVGYIPLDGEPKIIDVEPEDGSYLHALQELVGGCIEHVDVIAGGRPAIIVNDEGLLRGMKPNRVLFATKEMEEMGYLSWISGRPVKEGEPYAILFGPIVLESSDIDEDGEYSPRDITSGEFDFALGCMDDGLEAQILAYLLAAIGPGRPWRAGPSARE